MRCPGPAAGTTHPAYLDSHTLSTRPHSRRTLRPPFEGRSSQKVRPLSTAHRSIPAGAAVRVVRVARWQQPNGYFLDACLTLESCGCGQQIQTCCVRASKPDALLTPPHKWGGEMSPRGTSIQGRARGKNHTPRHLRGSASPPLSPLQQVAPKSQSSLYQSVEVPPSQGRIGLPQPGVMFPTESTVPGTTQPAGKPSSGHTSGPTPTPGSLA